ncbi:ABC transporter permease [Silvibacterium sp.]|uniref:ABC transporter permease n=1 Tax=Silvibacterium sp. TaxID=1964179 RepID=UPI0039E3CF5E
MRDTLLIAKREYLEQVRGKAFKLSTILIPVIFAALIGVAAFSTRNSGTGKRLAIADADFNFASRVAGQIANDRDAQATVEVVSPITPAHHAELVHMVDQKQIDGFLWIDRSSPNHVTAKYESRSSGDFITESRLQSALNHALVADRLIARGIAEKDVDSLTKSVDIGTMQVKNGQEVESSAVGSFWVAYAMSLLLTLSVMMYGMNVGRSIIQEKTSRIFEVMLSTVNPMDLLVGKLVGIGAVGFTQLAIWGAAGALFAGTAMAQSLLSSNGVSLSVSPVEIALFGVYFVLGYALYSTLFAGIAATCDTEQDFQQFAPLAAVPVWLSFGMISLILSNPNSIWSVLISFFPLCAPITMFLRLASQFPPAWQIAVSVGLMVLSVAVVMWFTSRIYRVGILMYGKRATLPEILRWLRYS